MGIKPHIPWLKQRPPPSGVAVANDGSLPRGRGTGLKWREAEFELPASFTVPLRGITFARAGGDVAIALPTPL